MAGRQKRGRGEGTVFKRKDGRWEGRYHDAGGRRRSVYAPTQRACLTKVRDAQGRAAAGRPEPATLTVERFLRDWLTDVVALKGKGHTPQTYAQAVENYLLPDLGRLRLATLGAADVQRCIAGLTRRGLAPTTVRQARAVLRSALADAVAWGLVGDNVAANTRGPRVPRIERPVLAVDDGLRLLAAMADDPLGAGIALALIVGLRRAEVLGLAWSDLALDGPVPTIRVEHQLLKLRGKAAVLAETKRPASRRALPLPALIVPLLRTRRVVQTEERLVARTWANPWDLVFTGEHGGPLHGGTLLNHYRAALRSAGLPEDLRLHDLRHSFGTILCDLGVPLPIVALLMGHGDTRTTLRYVHPLPGKEHEAMALLGEAYRRELPSELPSIGPTAPGNRDAPAVSRSGRR